MIDQNANTSAGRKSAGKDTCSAAVYPTWRVHPVDKTVIYDFIAKSFHEEALCVYRNCATWEGASEQPHSLLLELDRRPVAHLALWPKAIHIAAGPVTIGDIGAVVVDPAFRGIGLLHRLFAETISYARSLGLRVLLLGGNPDIYSKVGFATNLGTVHYILPIDQLRGYSEGLEYKLLPAVPGISEWQNLYGKGCDGSLRIRSAEYWAGLAQCFSQPSPRFRCLHTVDASAMIIAVKRANMLTVQELLAADVALTMPLLSAIANKDSELESIELFVGAGSPLDDCLQHWVLNHAQATRQFALGTQWRSLDSSLCVDSHWHLSLLDRR